MKKVLKIIALIALFIFIAIQFYQPPLNVDKGRVYATDFVQSYQAPSNIQALLRKSCYDCHSNNTDYRWYDYIQPARMLVEQHITDAKDELNFNEWDTYSDRKKKRLLSSIEKQIEKKEMPMPSYTLIHRDAKLNDAEIKTLTDWLKEQE